MKSRDFLIVTPVCATSASLLSAGGHPEEKLIPAFSPDLIHSQRRPSAWQPAQASSWNASYNVVEKEPKPLLKCCQQTNRIARTGGDVDSETWAMP